MIPQNEFNFGLFTEDIHVFGLVPFVFYMPDMTPKENEFIKGNGGEVSHLVECFTIQLYRARGSDSNHPEKLSDKERSQIPLELYSPGPLVSYQWLIEQVQ